MRLKTTLLWIVMLGLQHLCIPTAECRAAEEHSSRDVYDYKPEEKKWATEEGRTGFLIGGSIGTGVVFPGSDWGGCVEARGGSCISNRVQLYGVIKYTMYGPADYYSMCESGLCFEEVRSTASLLFLGIISTVFSSPEPPSPYLSAGLGISLWGICGDDVWYWNGYELQPKDCSGTTAFGPLFAIGVEFARHWSAEVSTLTCKNGSTVWLSLVGTYY